MLQDWVRVYDGPDLSFKVVRLRPGVRYHVRVQVGMLLSMRAGKAQHAALEALLSGPRNALVH